MSDIEITKDVLREINKGIKEFKKEGYTTPKPIQKHLETLNDFYDRNHLRVRHNQFTTSDKLNMEQWEELSEITKSFLEDNDVHFLEDYQNILDSGKFNKFKNLKGKKEIKDVQTLIDRMDMLSEEVDGVKLNNLLSSNQIIEVFNFAKRHNISESDMMDTIINEHSTGKKPLYGDDLQKKIYESYLGTEKPKKGKMGTNQHATSKKGGDKGNGTSVTIKKDKSNTGRRKTTKKRKR